MTNSVQGLNDKQTVPDSKLTVFPQIHTRIRQIYKRRERERLQNTWPTKCFT